MTTQSATRASGPNPDAAARPETWGIPLDQRPILLEAKNVSVDYITETGNVPACRDVSLTLRRGEILGVAGESASGKSTLLAALARLQRPPAVTSNGEVLFTPTDGETVDLARLSETQLVKYRWDKISIVMQSAMACLNPVMKVGAQFVDAILAHQPSATKQTAREFAKELLTMVGIPGHRVDAYPFELSGGMQQRALIALSMACQPDLVFMDEPTTAVDVIMQRSILTQVLELQEKLGFAIVFVTHDLSLLLEISHRIAIMYGGRIVEIGTPAELYQNAEHPYTRGLREAFPPLHEEPRRLSGIPGSPPDLQNLPPGCAFAPRCKVKIDRCETERPALVKTELGEVACHVAAANRKEAK
ncbi:ABC transporter ATP-binding protein [Micrococcales bacterium 31B]|nr:ABC transporter ATP-binding protein [Micrococcales bacterium 31B]